MKRKNAVLLTAAVAVVGMILVLLQNGSPDASSGASVSKLQNVIAVAPGRLRQSAVPAAPFALPTNQTATVRGTKPYVLRSDVKFQQSLRLAAEAHGARTAGILSPKELLVEADPATCRRLAADRRFSGVSEHLPAAKVQEELLALLKGGAKAVDVSVVTLAEEDRARVIACVTSAGGEMLTGCLNQGSTIRARLSPELVETLAGRGDVRWMERFVRPQLTNSSAVEPEAMNVRAVWDSHALSGEGQYISTSDSGIDTGDAETLHEDLRDRVLEMKAVEGCDMFDANGHGTHTAGSICGNGTRSDGEIRGSAWGAQLYVWFCGKGGRSIYTPNTAEELFRGTDNAWTNAYIHSASWGSDTSGSYTTDCVDYDTYVWRNPDFLPVFSNGNAGPGSQTVGSPAAAKNVLSVGATYNLSTGDPREMASFSSRGPCRDGRIKPDISAPGHSVTSTRSSCASGSGDYTSMSGTSMSCPLTAGAVALVRQWLVERKGFADEKETRPTAALMKAVVTGGAKDAAKPDNDVGWGRVDLEETLFPSNRAVRLVDRIPFAEGDEFYYVVETTNAAPLDVQLAWVDYPGSTGSESLPKLVNDLDLTVEPLYGDDASFYYGNGGDGPDTLNNLESVHVEEAPPNRYLITVSCSTVLYDHTKGGAAALYVRGAFDPTKTLEDETTGNVRILSSPTKLLMSLDSALKAAAPGDTIEILGPTKLKRARTVGSDVTICATNENPSASAVVFSSGAELAVDGGVTLALTNVVFANGERRTVDVLSDGVLKVSGKVELGEVRVADERCFCLAGPLASCLVVDAPFATADGAVFGRCAGDPADWNVMYLFNKYDDESAGEAGSGADWPLRWGVHPEVPIEIAPIRYEPADGDDIGYRTLDVLLKYHASPAGSVAVTRNNVWTNGLRQVSERLFLYGTADDLTVTPASTARLTVVPGGSLVISNLTFSGYEGPRLFHVAGGDMTLAYGAWLTDLVSNGRASELPDAGVVAMVGGSFTMLPGSCILNCVSEGYGGGLTAYGGTLRLSGGRISGCTAALGGGGVYVSNSGFPGEYVGVDVQLADDFTCWRNAVQADDLGLNRTEDNLRMAFGAYGDLLSVTAPLKPTARIGLNGYEPDDADEPFGVVLTALDPEERAATAQAFSWDDAASYDDEYYAAIVEDGGETDLVWKTRDPTTGQVEPDDANDLVIYDFGTDHPVTNYYDSLEAAFAYLQDDCTVVALLGDEGFDSDLTVAHRVELVSASETYGDTWLYRLDECSVRVPAGASLSLSNIVVCGCFEDPPGSDDYYGGVRTLVDVVGGALALERGSGVVNAIFGDGSWAAAGVCVSEMGSFAMRSGSRIESCANSWTGDPEGGIGLEKEWGRGGGLLLTSGTARLEGGTVSGCLAMKGGGVYVANEAVAYVSGDFTVEGNKGLCETDGGVRSYPDDNIEFDGTGRIVLAGELTGGIGVTRGTEVTGLGTNEFGTVDYAGDLCDLRQSAAKFRRDGSSATGVIVTNATANLLVWSDAVRSDAGGSYYEDDAGNRYEVVTEPGPPPPGPTEPTVTNAVPTAVIGLVYDGQAQTGVVEGVNFTLTGNVATNAGGYVAVATLTNGVWEGGSALPTNIVWSIAKATYDMSGVKFTNETHVCDGTVHSLAVSGDCPAGVTVSYQNNGQTDVGVHTVTAQFAGDATNYEPIPDMTATLTIVAAPTPPGPEPGSETTNWPSAIAFQSITRHSATEWALVVTDRVEHCRYRLLSTDDLTKGFTTTGAWDKATAAGAWETNVTTSAGQSFWRAEATWGIVPKDE